MFFVASKLFWALANPLSLTAILILLSILLAFARWTRVSVSFSVLALLVLGLCGWTTLGAVLLHPLEDRFPRPATLPEAVAGIVVLGGGFEGGTNRVRGGYELNNSADRFVEAAALAHQFPDAKVLITGGSGALMLEGEADADTAPRLFEALGISRDRLILENQSRDTYENAEFSKRLADVKPGETWLLVTSAFHMPRSVGLFRKADFAVTPWPSDYRTAGDETFGIARDNAFDSLQNTAIAMREWIGLLVYRLTGRLDVLLPSPEA